MRLKSRIVMTAQPTVISRRPIHALSGLPAMPSLPLACDAACLKGLPLHMPHVLLNHMLDCNTAKGDGDDCAANNHEQAAPSMRSLACQSRPRCRWPLMTADLKSLPLHSALQAAQTPTSCKSLHSRRYDQDLRPMSQDRGHNSSSSGAGCRALQTVALSRAAVKVRPGLKLLLSARDILDDSGTMDSTWPRSSQEGVDLEADVDKHILCGVAQAAPQAHQVGCDLASDVHDGVLMFLARLLLLHIL